jgi:hypothetical protein
MSATKVCNQPTSPVLVPASEEPLVTEARGCQPSSQMQGRRMKDFGPIHSNPRSINDYPGLDFPRQKICHWRQAVSRKRTFVVSCVAPGCARQVRGVPSRDPYRGCGGARTRHFGAWSMGPASAARGSGPLSPAREAWGAEDGLWNSGHRDRFGRLQWSRCR